MDFSQPQSPLLPPAAAALPQAGGKRDLTSRLQRAEQLVRSCRARGGLPRFSGEAAEVQDAHKLKYWRHACLEGVLSQCPPELSSYLDLHLPGWRNVKNSNKIITVEEQLECAWAIAQRYHERGGVLPRELRDHQEHSRAVEYKDAQKLGKWKQALKGSKHGHTCPPELKSFLDTEMPGWERGVNSKKNNASATQMDKARAIVARYNDRGKVLPRHIYRRTAPEYSQENKDAQKLSDWKHALLNPKRGQCPEELKLYLDSELPGWRDNVNSRKGQPSEHQIELARDIIDRYIARGKVFPRQWKDRSNPEKHQEYKDAIRLSHWKQFGGKVHHEENNLTEEGQTNENKRDGMGAVLDLLDSAMAGWRESSRERKVNHHADSSISHFPIDKCNSDTIQSSKLNALSADNSALEAHNFLSKSPSSEQEDHCESVIRSVTDAPMTTLPDMAPRVDSKRIRNEITEARIEDDELTQSRNIISFAHDNDADNGELTVMHDDGFEDTGKKSFEVPFTRPFSLPGGVPLLTRPSKGNYQDENPTNVRLVSPSKVARI